jgi:1,4-dihydroxy-2-naphthoate octaprenyltransferase
VKINAHASTIVDRIGLCFRSGVQWEILELIRALAIGILVQAASNVSNSYWDFVNGKDGPVVGQKPAGPVMAHKNVLTSGTLA